MTVYRLRSTGLQWREIAGETVVLDVPSSLYLSANASGSILWAELEHWATADSLAARLVAAFGIEPHRAAKDAEAFLATLDAHGLLEEEEAAA
jgi:Coenzyme PQQ synthesis protein D (PqqD)